MRKKWLGIALVVFAFPAVLFFSLNRAPSEPFYKGRPVSYWIKEGFYQPAFTSNQDAERRAREAVLKIGTNGLPYYISLLGARDSDIKVKMVSKVTAWAVKHQWKSPDSLWDALPIAKRSYAFVALKLLQTNAAPASPALTKILLECGNYEKMNAAGVLVSIGPRCIGILTNALTSTNHSVRWIALNALGEYGNFTMLDKHQARSPKDLAASAKLIVPILIDYVSNTNKLDRTEALISLGSFCQDAPTESKAIPIFIKYFDDAGLGSNARQALELDVLDGSTKALEALIGLLQNTNAQVRCEALEALNRCGDNAKIAVPEIVKALNDPDPFIRAAATNALERFDPAKLRMK